MAWGDEPPRVRPRRGHPVRRGGTLHVAGRVTRTVVGWVFGGLVPMVAFVLAALAFCSGPVSWAFDVPVETLSGRCAFVDPHASAALALEVELGRGIEHRYLTRLSCTDRRWTIERDQLGFLDEVEAQTNGARLHLVIIKVPAVHCTHDACRCERRPGRAPNTLSDRVEVDASLFPRPQ